MQLVLGPIIGHVTDHSVRLWLHTDQASERPIECHVYSDTARSKHIPGSPFQLYVTRDNNYCAVSEIPLPEPDHTYYYLLKYADTILGKSFYRFRNPARHPDKLVFAVVSCHRPFKYHGEKRMLLWRRLHDILHARQAQFVLHVGDQIYADNAAHFWQHSAWQQAMALVNDASDRSDKLAQIQRIYRDAYRLYWDFPEHHAVLSEFANYMIWDDHDITNGWGSDPRHKLIAAQTVFRGAQAVYRDFQHAHNPQNTQQHGPLYYGFHLGAASFLTLDLRSHRQIWDRQLLGTAQREWIEQFLTECSETRILCLISSVPLFHLKRRFANFPILRQDLDIRDQWSHDANDPDRQWLLGRLIHWLQQDRQRQLLILGGDVHVGTFAEARLQDNSGTRLFQATTTPISNKPAGLIDRLVKVLSASFVVDLIGGKKLDVKIKQRFWQRNFLLVTLEPARPSPRITLELFEEGKLEPNKKTIE